MTPETKNRILDYLFLIAVAIIAYWPVSLMQFSLKNDALNYFLPVRYNISEAVQHGYFPAWSPYINLGYPLHGDVQSGVWNPIVIVMSLIRKYDIYWLQVETIIAIIIAGFSMYHLLKYLKCGRKALLIVSSAYMMNGFISDSGQFINWIYAASFLPFVILSALQSFSSFSLRHSFKLGVSLSLMLVSSYPADFILLFYFLTAFVLYSLFIINKSVPLQQRITLHAKSIFFASVTFLIISSPALISFINFFGNVDRGNGVSLDSAFSNSLALVNFISFFAPWPTLSAEWHQYTDPLIRNCYPGFFLLLFFIYKLASAQKLSFVEKFLTVSIIFFILFSLGKYGGLRVFAYKYLPLMDTFRHPANAKLFFITAIQILAALGLKDFISDSSFSQKFIKKALTISAILAAVLLVISGIKSNLPVLLSNTLSKEISGSSLLKQIKDNLSFADMLLLNSGLLLIFISTAYFLNKKERLKQYLLPLVIFEMIIVLQGMLPLTYVKNLNPSQVQQIINRQPEGYPIPDSKISVAEFSKDGMMFFPTLGCLNPYNKKPGRVDYIITPSNLANQQRFWGNEKLRNRITQYPLFYFADTIVSSKETALTEVYDSDKKIAIVSDTSYMLTPDTASNSTIIIQKFIPGKMHLQVTTSSASLLVLQQNYYNKWKVFINGEKAQIEIVNTALMGVKVPEGNSEIVFYYDTKNLVITGLLSLLFFVVCTIFFAFNNKKNL